MPRREGGKIKQTGLAPLAEGREKAKEKEMPNERMLKAKLANEHIEPAAKAVEAAGASAASAGVEK